MAMTKTWKIAVLPGDGIGPEVTQEATRVLATAAEIHGITIVMRDAEMGGRAVREFESPFPDHTREACVSSDAVLLGAVGGPQFDTLPRPQRPEKGLLALRKALGGFANLRPAVAYPQLAHCSPLKPAALKGADVLFVRELLGGLYFGQPRGINTDDDPRGTNTMTYTRSEIERVARVAFEAARNRKKKLTSVDKANVLEVSQLWRDTVTSVGKKFPDVQVEHVLVDSCSMRLVTAPASFDVVVTENMFGDILSDEAAAITGSLGMLPSATIGGAVDLYEPIHGSAPDIAGKGIANPLGAIASVAMLFRHTIKSEAAAVAVEQAIANVLTAGYRTADIAASGTKHVRTEDMGALVAQAVEARVAAKAQA
jgi:3-isopropylmalate dehydrogenase